MQYIKMPKQSSRLHQNAYKEQVQLTSKVHLFYLSTKSGSSDFDDHEYPTIQGNVTEKPHMQC